MGVTFHKNKIFFSEMETKATVKMEQFYFTVSYLKCGENRI